MGLSQGTVQSDDQPIIGSSLQIHENQKRRTVDVGAVVYEQHVDFRCGACARRQPTRTPDVLAHAVLRVFSGIGPRWFLYKAVRAYPQLNPFDEDRHPEDPQLRARLGGAWVNRNGPRQVQWVAAPYSVTVIAPEHAEFLSHGIVTGQLGDGGLKNERGVGTDDAGIVHLECRAPRARRHAQRRNVAKMLRIAEGATRRGHRVVYL